MTEDGFTAETAGEGLDQAAFEALYLREEKPLYNTLYRWVWQEAEAMDLVQEAFVRLWRMRATVVPDGARALVYRIGLNLASNRRRGKKLWQWTELVERWTGRTPERSLLEDERRRRVRRAMEVLPEKVRRVVVLVRFAEMSYADIAALEKIPIGTVGSRYNTGVRLLTAHLEKEG